MFDTHNFNHQININTSQSSSFEPQNFSHKRHLQDAYDSQHNIKRRLVDTLNGLSIGKNQDLNNFSSSTSSSSSLFGSFTKEQLNKPLTDPNKIYIKNIDQFLHENPDQLDIIGEKLQLDDLRQAGLDKLIISCGLDLRKAWNKIVSQYKSKNYENKNIDDLIYKMIWEDYLAKYFSLIRFYNPLKIVWDKYQQWLKNKNHKIYTSPSITELDDDGDEIMIDDILDSNDDDNTNTNNNNANTNNAADDNANDLFFDQNEQDELADLALKEQNLRDRMSSYGSYYDHDNSFNSSMFNGYHMQHMVEDVDDNDDDIQMED